MSAGDKALGKVVLLGGTPRAGKTTLAVRLAHSGFNRVSLDELCDAIRTGLPDVVLEDWHDQRACAEKLFPFFASLVESALSNAELHSISTVFDMYDFTPEYLSRLPRRAELEVYYLAYPGTPVEIIRHNIRHYAQLDDWIAQVDEDYLDVVAHRCFRFNELLVDQCREYGFELVDTGGAGERQPALDVLYRRIVGPERILL